MKSEIRDVEFEVEKPKTKIEKEALEEVKQLLMYEKQAELQQEYYDALKRLRYYKTLAEESGDKKSCHYKRYVEMKKRLSLTADEERLLLG